MRRHLALLALAAVAAGCSHRDRSNPFDPGNPATRGRPIAFAAVAGHGVVTLRWQSLTRAGLSGYQAFRLAEGEPVFTALTGVLPAGASQFSDRTVENGREYRYQLRYVFDGGRLGQPAEDVATPGPLVPWVTDLARARLIRFTPDGRRVDAEFAGFDGPTQVAVNPATGLVWLTDTFAGTLLIFNPSNLRRVLVRDFLRPVAVAVDPARRAGWVCDDETRLVSHYTESGSAAMPGVLPFPFTLPIAAAVWPEDGSVWVCDNRTDRVHRFHPDGAHIGGEEIARPSRVAVDSSTGDAWVTSFETGTLVRVSASGQAPLTVDGRLAGPIGVAVDPRRGRVWVADAVGGQAVAFARDGREQFRIAGLREVREVAVDLATGDAWVTVPGARAIARLEPPRDRDGVVSPPRIAAMPGGLGQPYAVALDPGPR